ncbi:unnamed protein product [Lactuca virosa]|uniref:Uncharacterized protein n=1 Tax=Lactuca virosa TaxID=75947 RepID=A0AAU9M1A2_9ASTR|nr:unnamed protein product [Lactuca virosa]
MVKSQSFITCIQLLLVSSIATVGSRPATLNRRGLPEICDPLLEDCGDQWPFSPISSSDNPFISRPFLRRQTPPVLLPTLPPVVVASPPPTVSDPTFSPLVASPPPPGTTINPPTFPELPPDYDDDDDTNTAPPANDGANLPPEVTLPPIVHRRSQPDLYLSPPLLNLPAPPLVPIVYRQQEIVMPPPPPPPPTNK